MKDAKNYYTSGEYWERHRNAESDYKVSLLLSVAEKAGILFKEEFKGIEIGCGNGAFLIPLERELRKSLNHFEVIGYDISSNAIAIAKERIGKENARLRILLGSAEDIKEKVDYLFVMDVVEHVENPYEFLRALMGKSNYVFMHLPLENTLAHVVLGKPRQSYELFRHIHFFSWASAKILLEECKFKVIEYQFTGGSRETLHMPGSPAVKFMRYIRFLIYQLFPHVVVTLAGGSVMIVMRAVDD